MSYGEPTDQHRTTVREIAKAREHAAKNISALRRGSDDSDFENLCRIDGRKTPSLSVRATQAIVDYLLHLRPYRHSSEQWGVDLGVVTLPTSITEQSSRRGGDLNGFWLAQMPTIPLRSLTDVVDALNRTIIYTDSAPPQTRNSDNTPDESTIEIDGTTYAFPRGSDIIRKWFAGEATADELQRVGQPVEPQRRDDQYQPPRVTAGSNVRRFKFVLPQSDLLQLKEIADDVAEEMGMLADIDTPDHSADGGGAV